MPGWLSGCALWVLAVHAPAEAPVVVVTEGAEANPVERRIVAELRAEGFGARAIGPDPQRLPRVDALERAAVRAGAAAAVSLAQDETGAVEIWLVDRVTGKASLRRIEPQVADESGEVLAVRVVELLEASFLEVAADHPSRGDVPAPAPARPDPPPPVARSPRAWLGGGPWVAGSAGALRPTAGLVVSGGAAFDRRGIVGVDGSATVSLLRSRNESTLGTVVVGLSLVRAHVVVNPLAKQRVSPILGAGGGVAVAWAHGEPNGATAGRVDGWAAGIVSASTDLAIRLTPALRLRLGARVGWTTSPLAIDVGGERALSAGRPLIDGVIVLEWTPTRRR